MMRLICVTIVFVAGALLVCVGEIARSFGEADYRAGGATIPPGVIVMVVGFSLLIVELDLLPIRWLRERLSGGGQEESTE